MKDSQGVGHVSNTLVFFLCSSADDNFYDYQSDHIYWFLCVSYFINIVIDEMFFILHCLDRTKTLLLIVHFSNVDSHFMHL